MSYGLSYLRGCDTNRDVKAQSEIRKSDISKLLVGLSDKSVSYYDLSKRDRSYFYPIFRLLNKKPDLHHFFPFYSRLLSLPGFPILHSPGYRTKYKEFLKIDFPRIPYPENKDIFWQLVKLGGELRQLHLLESPIVSQYITKYPIDGTNEVSKISYNEENVLINDTQYFSGVPQVAWNFFYRRIPASPEMA